MTNESKKKKSMYLWYTTDIIMGYKNKVAITHLTVNVKTEEKKNQSQKQ